MGKDVTIPQLREEGYKAFYLGIGASLGSTLGIPGEELKNVYTAIDFLKAVNLGEEVYVGKNVAVVGGGNVAVDAARTAVRLGAESVTMIYRRTREEMPAAADEIAEAEEEGVKIMFLAAPIELGGKDEVFTMKVELMELGEADEKGRRKPVPTGNFEIIEVDSVISAIGQKINAEAILEGTGVQLSGKGSIIVDPATCQSTEPDIFAGGDAVTGPKFAIDAIAAGKEAAVSIHRFVHEGQTLIFGRDKRDYKALDASTVSLSVGSFDTAPRQKAKDGSAAEARKTFKDLRGILTEEQIKKETERCLGCGCVVIDEDLCVGCGICTTKCKFDAIRLEKTMDTVGTPYFRTLLTAVSNAPLAVGRLAKKKLGK